MDTPLTHLLQPEQLPTFGQRLALRLLHLLGWRMRFKPLPGPHGVAIVYPHTSNWDVVIGLLAKWSLALPFRWLAKEKLFRGLAGKTVGPILRSWGAIAVERSASTGATQQLARHMLASDWCWIALAPEGTRSWKPHWRSGFYHLAVTAKVPLLVVWFDYVHKEVGVFEYVDLSGDIEADMATLRALYAGHDGLHPELACPVELAPPRA